MEFIKNHQTGNTTYILVHLLTYILVIHVHLKPYFKNKIVDKKYKAFVFNHESFNMGEENLYKREAWPGGVYHFVNDNFKYLVENKHLLIFILYL